MFLEFPCPGWEQFPDAVQAILLRYGGTVVTKHESAEMRIWEVGLMRCSLRFVYEDSPSRVSVESSSDEGDLFIHKIVNDFK